MTSHLDRLASLLKRGPLTAAEIAQRTKCSAPTAYARVRALIARGEPVYSTTLARTTRSGPKAKAYGVY